VSKVISNIDFSQNHRSFNGRTRHELGNPVSTSRTLNGSMYHAEWSPVIDMPSSLLLLTIIIAFLPQHDSMVQTKDSLYMYNKTVARLLSVLDSCVRVEHKPARRRRDLDLGPMTLKLYRDKDILKTYLHV